jgi:toxin ParE1/3/4
MRRLQKTPASEQDLIDIGRYIETDNPNAAVRLLKKFKEKFELLAEFPGIGQRRDDLAPGLRSLPVGKYLIFYIPLTDGVTIVRVVHGARDLRSIFNPGE